jgi:hypothetical protein
MRHGQLSKFGAAIALLLSFVTACTEPVEPPVPQASLVFGPSPLECPTNLTLFNSAIITPLGGEVTVGGTSISLPAGAVPLPTLITVTIPASQFMEVEIQAAGVEHFLFDVPVTVSINYSRCKRSNIETDELSVWYWNPATKVLLENMNGIDNKLLQTMTFTTPHLSGFVIAN